MEDGNHTITRETKGEGLGQGITLVCSCGWRGITEYAYSDWQATNLRNQETRHLRGEVLTYPELEL